MKKKKSPVVQYGKHLRVLCASRIRSPDNYAVCELSEKKKKTVRKVARAFVFYFYRYPYPPLGVTQKSLRGYRKKQKKNTANNCSTTPYVSLNSTFCYSSIYSYVLKYFRHIFNLTLHTLVGYCFTRTHTCAKRARNRSEDTWWCIIIMRWGGEFERIHVMNR